MGLLIRLFLVCLAVAANSALSADAVGTASGPADKLHLASERTQIRGGWYFDVVNGKMNRNPGILVLNGKLYQIGGTFRQSDLEGAETVSLADDEYVLPGLIDMHGHYDVMLISPQTERRVDDLTVNPIVYLANGVTSTYTAGEYNPEAVRNARLRIDRGEQIGPRIFQAGPKFGKASPRWHEDATSEQVRELVDHWAEQGAVSFKAYGLKRDQLQALIQRAHQYGLTVTCHLMGRDNINPQEAVLMGIDRVEHYMGGDAFDPDQTAYVSLPKIDPTSAAFRKVAGLFLQHHVYFDPTITRFAFLAQDPVSVSELMPYWYDEKSLFTPYVQTRTRVQTISGHSGWEKVPSLLRSALTVFYDMGGRDLILMGSDNPSTGYYLAGFDDQRELADFVLAGIPPADALRFATLNGARALNVDDRLGSIETGKWADLFVVRGDPLTDIHNTRRIRLVMKAGHLYDPSQLLRSVVGKLGPTGPEDDKAW